MNFSKYLRLHSKRTTMQWHASSTYAGAGKIPTLDCLTALSASNIPCLRQQCGRVFPGQRLWRSMCFGIADDVVSVVLQRNRNSDPKT